MTATDFGEEDTAYYLVLSDQLQRVRNVLKAPGSSANRRTMKFRSASSRPTNAWCTTRDKGPFTPERTDILVLVRHQAYGGCGEWLGGMLNQGNLNRGVHYNVVVEQGVARLTGGRACASHLRWYRT